MVAALDHHPLEEPPTDLCKVVVTIEAPPDMIAAFLAVMEESGCRGGTTDS